MPEESRSSSWGLSRRDVVFRVPAALVVSGLLGGCTNDKKVNPVPATTMPDIHPTMAPTTSTTYPLERLTLDIPGIESVVRRKVSFPDISHTVTQEARKELDRRLLAHNIYEHTNDGTAFFGASDFSDGTEVRSLTYHHSGEPGFYSGFEDDNDQLLDWSGFLTARTENLAEKNLAKIHPRFRRLGATSLSNNGKAVYLLGRAEQGRFQEQQAVVLADLASSTKTVIKLSPRFSPRAQISQDGSTLALEIDNYNNFYARSSSSPSIYILDVSSLSVRTVIDTSPSSTFHLSGDGEQLYLPEANKKASTIVDLKTGTRHMLSWAANVYRYAYGSGASADFQYFLSGAELGILVNTPDGRTIHIISSSANDMPEEITSDGTIYTEEYKIVPDAEGNYHEATHRFNGSSIQIETVTGRR